MNTVIFLTGRPKSGKTTLAYTLKRLMSNSIVLDGDELRACLNYKGFSKEDRDEWVKKVGSLAINLSLQGYVPIIALVSPYSDIRKEVREMCEEVGINFLLVYIKGSDKYMWDGSIYEEPKEDEEHITIDRTEGKTDYEGIFHLYHRCLRQSS